MHASEKWRVSEYSVKPTEVTRVLRDGDIIDLGDRRFTGTDRP